MKGVILAGGTGSRLYPSTKVTNKHLLPVYNKPMIYYPIETLKQSGVREVLIISSPEHAGDFMQLLGSGVDFGVHFTYKIQDGAGGIAQALSLAEGFAGDDNIAVILSDNIFEDEFSEEVFYFQKGAQIFVKEVEDASRFGVAEIRKDGTVRSIEEKPDFPKSNFAQTGLYIYDNRVFDLIRQIQPSKRGELEITDVNNLYLEKNELKAIKINGMWIDAGTHDSLLEASILAQEAFNPEKIQQKERRHSSVSETQMNMTPKVTVGISTYNSEAYIKPCIESLLAQDYDNLEVVVFDNHSVDTTKEQVAQYADVKLLESEVNLGFGAGHNEIIRHTDGDFYACLNIDMIFEPNFISELVKTALEKPIYGSIGGKLKRWDFQGYEQEKGAVREMGKTNFIDSVGLRVMRSHRFEDMGQGEVDYGQFDESREVFGVSGAAVLYRRKALEDIAFHDAEKDQKEYFDESMFMYKEDIDLAYRLQWAGWKSLYSSQAVAYHDRTAASAGSNVLDMIRNRSRKAKEINRRSYLNHRILLEKNFSGSFSSSVRGATWWWNFKIAMYLFFFETETLGQWWQFMKLRKKIQARKKAMPRRVQQSEIEQFMEG